MPKYTDNGPSSSNTYPIMRAIWHCMAATRMAIIIHGYDSDGM